MHSDLTHAERAALVDLWTRWSAARAAKDYAASDALRAELEAWGCLSPDYRLWHPVFESPEHRAARLVRRAS